MKTLARLIREAGIRKSYFLYGRSDTIGETLGFLRCGERSALKGSSWSLEIFRDEDLQYIETGLTLAGDNENAVKVLQDLDTDIYASFIVAGIQQGGSFRI